jgi:hypothetical protein
LRQNGFFVVPSVHRVFFSIYEVKRLIPFRTLSRQMLCYIIITYFSAICYVL